MIDLYELDRISADLEIVYERFEDLSESNSWFRDEYLLNKPLTDEQQTIFIRSFNEMRLLYAQQNYLLENYSNDLGKLISKLDGLVSKEQKEVSKIAKGEDDNERN